MLSTPSARDHTGRRVTVLADDGVPLAVQEFGRVDAPITAVFVHGHCLRTESWSFLREYLSYSWGTDVRMVFYDHRGHGDSGHGPVDTYTIDQLGRDLDAVIRTVVPEGPVVLIGHSMGGMTALAYARQYPDSIGSRIVGMALISSAANGLTEAGLGRLLHSPMVSFFRSAVRRAPRVMQGSKHVSRMLCAGIVRVVGCGSGRVDSRVVALAAAMVNDTSVVTMSSFLESLIGFDESASLSALASIPSLVLCGDADVMTPFEHSASMASRLPASELVRVSGAGHSVILERAAEVAHAVAALVARAGHGERLANVG
ncbi:alpha/beta fold hydrolase [Rhodococcus sp. NPDC058481]|uniref:alpha/beta fold hydrolase n=2 Tax=Rhodococcus TaxID=1827 RepID=UPI00364A59A4